MAVVVMLLHLPLELLQLVVVQLYFVSSEAPMVAAVCQFFDTAARAAAQELRARSDVLPRRFAVVVQALPPSLQMDGKVSTAEQARLARVVAQRAPMHKLIYGQVMTNHALLQLLDVGNPQCNRAGWLNDEVVDCLFALTIPRVSQLHLGQMHACSIPSFAFKAAYFEGHKSLRAMTVFSRKPNPQLMQSMMACSVLIAPCSSNGHWWDIFFNMQQQRLEIACSLGWDHMREAEVMLRWLASLHSWHTGTTLDVSMWQIWHFRVPQQVDHKSCGIFAWLSAVHRAELAPFAFGHTMLHHYRCVAALLLLSIRTGATAPIAVE